MRKLLILLPLLWGCMNDAWPEFREECKEFCTLWDLEYYEAMTDNSNGTVSCTCYIPDE